MEVIRPVVGGEGVGLAGVEGVEAGVGDAVGDAADGLAEEGGVVGFVVGLGGEALDDVVGGDSEGLEDCAEGEEGDGGVGHGWGRRALRKQSLICGIGDI